MNTTTSSHIKIAVLVLACFGVSFGSLHADDNGKLKTLMNQRKALRTQIAQLIEFAQKADREAAYYQELADKAKLQAKEAAAGRKRYTSEDVELNWARVRQDSANERNKAASHAREQIELARDKIGDIDLEIAALR